MSKKMCLFLLLFGVCSLVLAGCVKKTSGSGGTAGLYKNEKETTVTEATDTDSSGGKTDLVVVVKVDTSASQISVKSTSDGKMYLLNYTGGTSVQNRFGTEMLMEDVILGEMAEVNYTPGTQKLISIRESDDAWENTTVSKWSIDYDKNIMTIGSDKYSFDGNIVVISDGRQIDVHQLNTVDSLIVKGIDKKVCSINVKTGHGYIKVTNETNLIGGLIEVGTNIMTVISENMIIVAPEGTYTLTASKNGVGGSMEIVVNRDDETTVSLSGFQQEIERDGSVRLNIQPEGVQYNVFIDGKSVDAKEAISLSYGTHQLVITSDKYTDYQEKLIISSIYMNKTIDLSAGEEETTATEETTETEETTASGEEETTASGEEEDSGVEVTTAETNNRYVVVSGPVGAEIYQDGIYMGTAPVTFAKKEGDHIFVLRQDGYKTTAYSYTFDSTAADVYIKFPELTASGS